MTGLASPTPDAPPDGASGDEWPRAPLSPALPSVAGIYDALLGGEVRGVVRSGAETVRFLDGLELVPPRLADVAEWRPGWQAASLGGPVLFWSGVGRKPRSGR
jgi:S-adenosyl methyltransferase